MNTLFGATSSARIIGPYRYTLTRVWEEERPRACFVMLNPSTADASQEDPTIRRCLSFARSWGYGSLDVVNLFAFRATKPADLFSALSPIGEENDRHLIEAFSRSERIIAAWGVGGVHLNRDRAVCALAEREGKRLFCLGRTKEGQPRHPLYVKGDTELEAFESGKLNHNLTLDNHVR